MTDHVVELPISGCVPGAAVASSAGGAGFAASFPFFAGTENQLLATALADLIPDPSQSRPPLVTNPVLLWGPSGTGKSHLVRGICRLWRSTFGEDAALCLTARQYRQELIAAIDTNEVDALRRHWRAFKLLAIDDIHRLPSDAYLNNDLLHTIDGLAESNATLLLASAVAPGSLTNLSLAVRSRISSGCPIALAPPGLATRKRVVKEIASHLDRRLSDSAATLVASHVSGTTNDLAGVFGELVHGVDAPKSLTDDEVTQFFQNRNNRCRPKFADIVRVVAKHYGVPQKTLKGSSRRRSVALARSMVVYLTRETLELSFDRIGRALSGRDHTTIMHSYRKIQQLAKTDLATNQAIADLRRLLIRHVDSGP